MTRVEKAEEAAAREPVCAGCGAFKGSRLIVCWLCWRELKNFDGSLEEWLKTKGRLH